MRNISSVLVEIALFWGLWGRSVGSSSPSASTEEMELVKQVEVKDGLVMDIDWVMQMNSFGFSGFFCELLGLSSGLKAVFPELRVTKAFFRNAKMEPLVGKKGLTIDEENIMTEAFFANDLMDQERDDMKWLTDPVHGSLPKGSSSDGNEGDKTLPRPKFAAPFLPSLENTCMESTLVEVGRLPVPGSELSRSYNVDAHSNPEDCCRACQDNPLCTFWSFAPFDLGPYGTLVGDANKHRNKCIFGGLQYVPGRRLEGAYSGVMAHNSRSVENRAVSEEGEVQGVLTTGAPSRHSVPRAVIYHGTTCYQHNSTLITRDTNEIRVGRYMFERASFRSGMNQDEYAVVRCVSLMDEVWVPTMWHKAALTSILRSAGGAQMANSVAIAVIPESVDVDTFDPSLVRSQEDGNPFRTRSRNPEDLCWCEGYPDISGPVKCTGTGTGTGTGAATPPERFEFLSIFKWEHRKGWDVLLSAYWSAFTAEDSVVLRLRTYIPSWATGVDPDVYQHVESFAQSRFGRSASELAPVVWEYGRNASLLSESLSRADVRDLLASADAFVLPTRGEGWGLPIAEAMAMRLPTIVSASPGPRAFATTHSAYLVSGQDDAAGAEGAPAGFFEPDAEELAGRLREVIQDSGPRGVGRALARTARAREDMRALNPVRVASLMADRLRMEGSRRGWEF